VLFSRRRPESNRRAPPTGHGVGWNKSLERLPFVHRPQWTKYEYISQNEQKEDKKPKPDPHLRVNDKSDDRIHDNEEFGPKPFVVL
jgi:hypothetical protein